MAASSRLFDPKNENLATEAYARANTSFRPALTLYVLLEWTPTPWKRKKNQKYCSKNEKLLSAYSFLVSLNDNWYTCGLNIGCYMRERTRDVELKQTAWTGGWGKRGKLSELARCNGKPIDVNSPGTFLPSVGKQKEREGDGEWERGMKMLMKSTVNECKFIFELLSSLSILAERCRLLWEYFPMSLIPNLCSSAWFNSITFYQFPDDSLFSLCLSLFLYPLCFAFLSRGFLYRLIQIGGSSWEAFMRSDRVSECAFNAFVPWRYRLISENRRLKEKLN